MKDRIAQLIVRWRWAIIVAWGLLGYFAARKAPHVLQVLNVRGGSKVETEASRADRLLRERFAKPLNEFFAVTIDSRAPLTDAAPHQVLDSLTAVLKRQSYVGGVISFESTHDSTFMGRDGKTEFFLVALDVPTPDSVGPLVIPVRRLVRQVLQAAGTDTSGFKVRVTGRSPLDLDIRNVSASDSKRGETRLLPLTMVVLVLAFGALVAACLPLIVGFLAIWITLALVTVIAGYTPMSIFVLNMTTMLGLGVGIDYSLLIVTRFREELNRGLHRRDAAERALRTAGAAVVTSGLTVVVGFAALLLTPLVETRSVGIGGLVVVGVAVALATTLLPALLAVLGRQIDRPRWLARRLAWYHAPTAWERWARSLGRHPKRALTVGAIAIGILTAPVFWIRIGLPARNWWPAETESGQGVKTLERMGVASVIQPVRVVVELPAGQSAVSSTSLRGLRTLSDSLRDDPRVDQVKSIVDVDRRASILQLSLLYSDLPAAHARLPGFLEAYLSRDGRVALMDVILRDTTSLTGSMDVARHIRVLRKTGIRHLEGAKIFVGGYTAAALDLQNLLLDRFPLLVCLILLCTGVMLAIAFRSLLVPVKAVIMNSLSVCATFGLIVLVFQHGFGSRLLGIDGPTSAIFVVIPVLVFAVVFGLSMDYEVFLLARVKEAFDKTGRNDQAMQEGLSATASTITSAALIMILVFGAFAFARVLAMQFLGFGLAVAVLLDATIIRMVLVPAIMHLAGEWNWWPGVRIRRRRKETTAPLAADPVPKP
ncbi:MAG: MMPL family transporter [Gemmatimonadota bacterium]